MAHETEITDLKDRLLGLQKSTIPVCPVVRVKGEIGDDAAQVLDSLLGNKSVGTTTIHRELRSSGLAIARDSIANHRKGFCACNEGIK